jgi:tetratricopeptide (TPR) repeat protein
LTEQEKEQEALKHYREGVKLSQEEKFAEAVEMFREAVGIDPKLKAAYEELGYSLYRLKRYEESIQASDTAINLIYFDDDFKPYYNLGLVHFERENWPGAVYAFRYIVNKSLDPYPWKDEYTEAYYHLGFSLAKAGDLHDEIQVLETDWRLINDLPIKRFELATFYLCAGRRNSAKKQYRLLLENGDFNLAEELLKLIKKHG